MAASACAASSSTGPGAAEPGSESEAARLRAERRQHRQDVRDLENELAQIKAELGSIRRHDRAAPVAPPDSYMTPSVPPLPIDTRGPAAPTAVPEPAGSPTVDVDGVPVQVAGYDSDGVQILYVGEAASAPAVAPTVDLSRPAPARPRRSSGSGGSGGSLAPVPVVSDRLEVTRGAGPAVDVVAARRPVPAAPAAPAPAAALAPAAPAPAAPAPTAPAPTAPAPARETPKERYQRALQALRAGDHAAAIAGFRAFVRDLPHSDYADNAQYWLGEAYYDQRDFRTAMAELKKVVQRYHDGNKVADAELKIAYCHLALGEGARARDLLGAVISHYPNSHPAALAADKLKTLSPGNDR